MVMSLERPDVERRPATPTGGVRGPLVLALALLVPVVLVAGVLGAQARQPPGTYDAVGQTVSTLAGRGATDRWFMSVGLAVLGLLFLAVAVGLAVPRRGRVVLGTGAVLVVAVAFAPQPAVGSSTVHMSCMVVGTLAFVGWPLALAADRRLDPRLRRGSVAASAGMAVALGWLCAQAWTDGTWLGVAERVLLLAETVWPIRVAAWSWRTARRRPAREVGAAVTVVLALLPPVVFVVGLATAQAAQLSPRPFSLSLSQLSGLAATSRWMMTATLMVIGLLYVLVAAGLSRAPVPARLLLALGGATLVVVGLAPQPTVGASVVHLGAGAVSWAAFCTWPLGLACSSRVEVRVRRASAVAVVVVVGLAAWFTHQFLTGGGLYGVSERILFSAESVWPIGLAVEELRRRARPASAPASE